jgi:2-methylisocitrate lyase-like PEP mutase family enzyme
VLANAWDVGSARVLAALGAEAIATSSAAHAFTLGRPDMGHVSREESLVHARSLVDAVDVPVSGDLENGYGPSPDDVAETICLAAAAGLAGCSIEDTALPSATPYDLDHAVSRIEAGVAAARALDGDFVLVARADGVMNQQYDVDEAIVRIVAFESVGADCVYVPLPPTMADLIRICQSVSVPVNALAAGPFTIYSREEFAAAGVARISNGSALARVTHRAIVDAGRSMFGPAGDFSALGNGISGSTVDDLLAEPG